MNHIQIIGNVGQNPELDVTKNGSNLLKFSVAVNEYYGSGDDKKDITTWFSVVVWGDRAVALSKSVKRGSRVFVDGKIRQNKYTDKDGVSRTSFEIVANTVYEIKTYSSQDDSGPVED